MSNTTASTVENLKGFVTFLREAVIVVVLVLLLVFPRAINNVLTQAGFTEASIAGVKWQRELEVALQKTEDASQSVTRLEGQLQTTSAQLDQIRASAATPPAVRAQISALSTSIERTQSETRAVRDSLQNSLTVQQSIMQRVAPKGERR